MGVVNDWLIIYKTCIYETYFNRTNPNTQILHLSLTDDTKASGFPTNSLYLGGPTKCIWPSMFFFIISKEQVNIFLAL